MKICRVGGENGTIFLAWEQRSDHASARIDGRVVRKTFDKRQIVGGGANRACFEGWAIQIVVVVSENQSGNENCRDDEQCYSCFFYAKLLCHILESLFTLHILFDSADVLFSLAICSELFIKSAV